MTIFHESTTYFNTTRFFSREDTANFRNVSTHLDYFKVFSEYDYDCFRFNAATNKSYDQSKLPSVELY